ncbi:hypothetical protein [Allokutzneria albata]|uniref:Flp pilus-assembly TadE/G-like n=1 Tax=Allokutzneria albata TaxID=211114 RepID=A0A1G9Y9T0_ALLAB|nr:hypothetical protein [Allokutzneria albata]SDN05828.1 hypothetical protein SAMN04489726_4686 [Allokutzneria albata]
MTAFLVVLTTTILAAAGLVLDGGHALAAKIDALGLAREAARTGAQELDLDHLRSTGTVRLSPRASAAAAREFLREASRTGTASATSTTVTVIVTITRPTQLLRLLGITELTVTATATAQPRTPSSTP